MPGPDFLDLPARAAKPRHVGITHVLDRGIPLGQAADLLAPADVRGLETLRLSLRADTYGAWSPGSLPARSR